VELKARGKEAVLHARKEANARSQNFREGMAEEEGAQPTRRSRTRGNRTPGTA
jgi:hypothetical protein